MVSLELAPPPAYDAICEANGGYDERADDPARLPAALERALDTDVVPFTAMGSSSLESGATGATAR